MAIPLPFFLQLEPLAGITLLLGCYGGAWYGGAIPAILIKVPGTPVKVLTTCDGYPMTRRGAARRIAPCRWPILPPSSAGFAR